MDCDLNLIKNLLLKIQKLENEIIEKDNKINKLYTMIGKLVEEKDKKLNF
jgi:hypothetical protein